MSHKVHGELIPTGGGDNVPLIRELLTVGRRESCDICMPFPNISGMHCELSFRNGYWYIRDLNSTNGIKVNGVRVADKLLHPGDDISIGKRRYTIQYNLPADGHVLEEETSDDILKHSLLERAGLEKPKRDREVRGKGKPIDPADFLLDDE